MNLLKTKPLLLVVTLLALMPSPASAAASSAALRWQVAQQGRISLDEATAKVQQQTGGRVLSARTRQQNGHTFYRIKVLLPSGTVRVVEVDAATGEMN